jgi:hypothetical protein
MKEMLLLVILKMTNYEPDIIAFNSKLLTNLFKYTMVSPK